MTAALQCNDCDRPTAEDDTAPSCGAHVLCVSCFLTGDFRCRECRRVWDETADGEMKVAAAQRWFERVAAVPSEPFPTYVEPERPGPLDLTGAHGVFEVNASISLHLCAHCKRGIHVGRPRVDHRLSPTSAVTDRYHPECVVLP